MPLFDQLLSPHHMMWRQSSQAHHQIKRPSYTTQHNTQQFSIQHRAASCGGLFSCFMQDASSLRTMLHNFPFHRCRGHVGRPGVTPIQLVLVGKTSFVAHCKHSLRSATAVLLLSACEQTTSICFQTAMHVSIANHTPLYYLLYISHRRTEKRYFCGGTTNKTALFRFA